MSAGGARPSPGAGPDGLSSSVRASRDRIAARFRAWGHRLRDRVDAALRAWPSLTGPAQRRALLDLEQLLVETTRWRRLVSAWFAPMEEAARQALETIRTQKAEMLVMTEAAETALRSQIAKMAQRQGLVNLPPETDAHLQLRTTWTVRVVDRSAIVRAVADGQLDPACVDINLAALRRLASRTRQFLDIPGVVVEPQVSVAVLDHRAEAAALEAHVGARPDVPAIDANRHAENADL